MPWNAYLPQNRLTSWRLEPCIATGKSKFSWMNWRLWPPLTLQDFIFEPGSQRDFCSSWKMLTSGTKFIWVWRNFFHPFLGLWEIRGWDQGVILKNAQVRPSAPIDFCDPRDPYYRIKSKKFLHTLLQGYRKYQHLAAGLSPRSKLYMKFSSFV